MLSGVNPAPPTPSPADLAEAGLGLDYGRVALVEAPEDWLVLAAALIRSVSAALKGQSVNIEHVGSTAVPSLLSKPILDLAIGVPCDPQPGIFTEELASIGWEYRGDAGEGGGLVFVLETRPRHRVAHIHIVRQDGLQWRNYVAFRELLRSDAAARATYASAKQSLLASFASDRKSYQAGKETTVAALLTGLNAG